MPINLDAFTNSKDGLGSNSSTIATTSFSSILSCGLILEERPLDSPSELLEGFAVHNCEAETLITTPYTSWTRRGSKLGREMIPLEGAGLQNLRNHPN